MSSPDAKEKRQTQRYPLGRVAAMFVGDDGLPHYCLVSDFSENGVQIKYDQSKIPDEFVLVFNSSVTHRNGTYKVVWRKDSTVGAEFVGATAPRT